MGERSLVTIPLMDEGGLDGAFFAVYVPQPPAGEENYDAVVKSTLGELKLINRVSREELPDRVEIASGPRDVRRIYDSGKKIVIPAIENGYAIGDDIGNVQRFFDLGCRYITLSHNEHNQICDSNTNPGGPESIHNGLSDFGRKVVTEMNRIGVIVDISHVSKKSMLDAVRVSRAPVIASHSGCRAVCDESRNLDDEQLIALKENGGVINIVGLNTFIKKDSPERTAAVESIRREMGFSMNEWLFFKEIYTSPFEIQKKYKSKLDEIDEMHPAASIADFVDHIDYAANLIGIDHAGIASDFFDDIISLSDWRNAGQTKGITSELVRRGYSESHIEKLWSGNIMRAWSEVENLAG